MTGKKPRRIFQIDGVNGGVLSIAEKPAEGRILLIISHGDQEAQIALDQEMFQVLTELRYDLRFSAVEFPQAAPAIKAVA